MADRPVAGEVEERSAPRDATAPTLEGNTLVGRIPLGVESRSFGSWREKIARGAFANADRSCLVCTLEHDTGRVLGRFPATLQTEDYADHIEWRCDLPNGPTGQDVREALRRGDLNQTSWRMVVGRDRWQGALRIVEEVREWRDVALVCTSAYADARAELRHAPEPEPAADAAPDPPPEATVPNPPTPTGGLQVESRSASDSDRLTPEQRIMSAIASVPPGECRDLVHATAAPVEPDDLRTVLIDRFREASVVAASGVPIVPTDAKNVKWPILTGDVDVSFYDELEEIDESDPDLDEFEVPVKALKALVRMSTEAAEDSDPDLLQLVTDNLNTAMVLKGDRELVRGSDVKGFPGLLNVTGTQSLSVDGALSWDHVIKAVGLLAEALVPPPFAVLLGPRPLTALDLTKEQAGSNLYVGRPDGIPPVFSTAWLPITGTAPDEDTSAIVYAPGQQMIVIRRTVTVEIDRSQAFSSDAILARGRYRLGLGVPHPQSIVKLTGIAADPIT